MLLATPPVPIETPLDTAPIADLLKQIAQAWAPLSIWLFGSRARGTARPDSDWDLLVVVSDRVAEQGATDPMVAWDLRQRARVWADIIVVSHSDFEAFKSVPNTLAFEAVYAGVRLS